MAVNGDAAFPRTLVPQRTHLAAGVRARVRHWADDNHVACTASPHRGRHVPAAATIEPGDGLVGTVMLVVDTHPVAHSVANQLVQHLSLRQRARGRAGSVGRVTHLQPSCYPS
jgi:hypothetical protein